MMHRLPIIAATAALSAALVAPPRSASAQDIAGEYQVEVRGTVYHLDRDPEQRTLRDNTTLTVEQQGDEIVIEFRSFASAMSATAFRGRVGNGRFVAVWSSASGGAARLITGEVDGRRLRGRLIYPRATADATVPGWTEVEFSAVPHERTGQATPTPAVRSRVPVRGPVGLRPRPAPDAAAEFAVEVSAVTDPEAPLAGHRITFLARATPTRSGESVERVELWVNGLVQGSSEGSVLDVVAGPFGAGRLTYDIVAVSSDGRRSEPLGHTVDVTAAGNATITGLLEGAPGLVTDVQLVRPDGRTIARSAVDEGGRYRFSGVPAGNYVIFVNDAKREAIVSPTSNLEIEVDGRRTYRRNFEVR